MNATSIPITPANASVLNASRLFSGSPSLLDEKRTGASSPKKGKRNMDETDRNMVDESGCLIVYSRQESPSILASSYAP